MKKEPPRQYYHKAQGGRWYYVLLRKKQYSSYSNEELYWKDVEKVREFIQDCRASYKATTGKDPWVVFFKPIGQVKPIATKEYMYDIDQYLYNRDDFWNWLNAWVKNFHIIMEEDTGKVIFRDFGTKQPAFYMYMYNEEEARSIITDENLEYKELEQVIQEGLSDEAKPFRLQGQYLRKYQMPKNAPIGSSMT